MYEEIIKRLKQVLKIENQQDLANILKITKQAVSKQKKKNAFPDSWSMEIGEKYQLCPYWIKTGKGERRRGSGTEDPYAVKLAEWMELKSREDDRARSHIEITIEEALPEFKKWLKKKRI